MQLAIETCDLGKRYGRVTAVEQLSLHVEAGEIYAFLGLNGAGKTTTIRMLLGMIRPTNGTATVLGTQVRQERQTPWSSVGYLVEKPRMYPELTVFENLEVARRLHPGTPRSAIDGVVQRLGLASYADRRAGQLSQGNRQRLGLAKALLHAPQLLILDEPANGLDPAGIVEIRGLLQELTSEEGVTVLMSSHLLGEVARVANRIGIIHRGRLLQEVSAQELSAKRQRALHVRVHDPQCAQFALASAGISPVSLREQELVISDAEAVAHPDRIASLLVNTGMPPTRLLMEEEELEQYFLRLTGENGSQYDANVH